MAIKEYNVDLDIKGKVSATTVPNSTGSIVTWNSTTNVFGLRTNAQIISDLGLVTSSVLNAGLTTKANANGDNLTNIGTWRDNLGIPDVTGFIPYTGANQDVNLNNRNLGNVAKLQLNQQTATDTFLQLPPNNISGNLVSDVASVNALPPGTLFYKNGRLMMKVALYGTQASIDDASVIGNVSSGANADNIYGGQVQLANLMGLGFDHRGGIRQSYNFDNNLKGGTPTALNIVGHNYGQKLQTTSDDPTYPNTTYTGNHPDMYEGFHLGTTGGYASTELYVDNRGQIFARKGRLNQNPGSGTNNGWLKYLSTEDLTTQLSNYVPINGDTTVNNTKTFTSSPIVPNATLNGHAVNLGQLNSAISGIAVPNNGLLTISTSSDLTGGGTFSADQATASNVNIGLSSGTLSDIQLGVTANSLVINGGIPRTSQLLNNTNDLDLVVTPGYYHYNGGSIPLNRPASGAAYLEVVKNGSFMRQAWRPRSNGSEYQRTRSSNGVWSDWVVYYNSDNFNPSDYALVTQLSGYVPTSRTITINGTTFDLSQNRTWNIPNTDTITRLRGTTSGTYTSGDLTLLEGTGIGITQIGSNFTITNTAPNATHTGDVTGSTELTIANNAVTFAKMQNIATQRFLGRVSSSTGNVEALTAAQMQSALGYLTSFTETDPTVPSHVKAITTGDIDNWNDAYSWGDHASAGYLVSSDLTGYATESWVNAQGFSTQTLSSSTSNLIVSNTVQRAALTGDVTASQNSNVTTIANSAVTHAKYQNIATQRILGRGATGTGNVQELTLGANLTLSTAGVLSATNTNTTYSAGTGLTLSGTTFGQTITTSGTGTIVTGITQTSNGFQVNLGTPPTSTYTAGTGISIASNVITNSAPNVQADWNATSGLAQILNKPTIPTSSDFITTNTTQTGLNGDKTTSGRWVFRSFDAVPLRLENTNVANLSISYGLSGSVWYAGLANQNAYAIGNSNWALNSVSNRLFWIDNTGLVFSKNGFNKYGQNDTQILLAGGGHRPVSDFALVGSLSGYLPLSGGTMNTSAVINFNYQGGLAHAGSNRLRFTNNANVFSANVSSDTALAFYFRPQGDTVTTGQVSIQGDGQINTANHGNSSQWKQAYDWGRGLRVDGNGITEGNIFTGDTFTVRNASVWVQGTNRPNNTNSAVVNFTPNARNYGFSLGARSNRLYFVTENNSVFDSWLELYHTGNLTFGSGLTYNSTTGVLTASQDSIFAYSPQGGLYTTNWFSNALGQYSLAIGHASNATAQNATAVGSAVFTGGFGSTNVGFSSNVNKSLAGNFGTYNTNNYREAFTYGLGLQTASTWQTVIGRYNKPNGAVDEDDWTNIKNPIFILGVGQDEMNRKNSVSAFGDGRLDYEVDRDDTNWTPNTLPDIRWIQENISGGGGGNMNFAYIDHTNTHVFGDGEANGLLIPISLASGTPLGDPILSVIYVYTSHNDLGRYSTPTVDTFFNAIAVEVKGDVLVRRGCVYIGVANITTVLGGKDKLVMVYDRKNDVLWLEWMDDFDIMDLKDIPGMYGILIGNAFNGEPDKAYFNVNPQIL